MFSILSSTAGLVVVARLDSVRGIDVQSVVGVSISSGGSRPAHDRPVIVLFEGSDASLRFEAMPATALVRVQGASSGAVGFDLRLEVRAILLDTIGRVPRWPSAGASVGAANPSGRLPPMSCGVASSGCSPVARFEWHQVSLQKRLEIERVIDAPRDLVLTRLVQSVLGIQGASSPFAREVAGLTSSMRTLKLAAELGVTEAIVGLTDAHPGAQARDILYDVLPLLERIHHEPWSASHFVDDRVRERPDVTPFFALGHTDRRVRREFLAQLTPVRSLNLTVDPNPRRRLLWLVLLTGDTRALVERQDAAPILLDRFPNQLFYDIVADGVGVRNETTRLAARSVRRLRATALVKRQVDARFTLTPLGMPRPLAMWTPIRATVSVHDLAGVRDHDRFVTALQELDRA